MKSPDKQSKSIVFVGKLNPSIFQPIWFSGQKLIGKQEGEGAELNVIHPDIVNFKISWCNIEVTRERFVVTTTQEHAFELIRDLAIGTFLLLSHTPINMLGINTEMHFRMKDAENWHQLGHKLAPKNIFWDETLINPGTRSVVIQGERPDDYIGHVQVSVEPSDRIKFGVKFRINDHYQLGDQENIIGSDSIVNILEHDWINAQDRSETIISHVLEKSINN